MKESKIVNTVLTNIIELMEAGHITPEDFVLDFADNKDGSTLGRVVLSFTTKEGAEDIANQLSEGVEDVG